MPIDIETPFIVNAIRAKARQLKAHTCFSNKDFEDIEADLFAHLWKIGLAFPPGQLIDAPLIHTILNRKGVDMLRFQMRKRELARHNGESLDAITSKDENGYSLTLGDVLTTRDPSIADEAAFHIDFVERLSTLPCELRVIVEKMMQGRNHADIAREMNLSRDTFHRKYATRIQKTIFPEQYAKTRKSRLQPRP